MLVLRAVAVLAIIAIGGSILISLMTRDRRYLWLAWRITRYALLVMLILFGLMIAESLLVPVVSLV